MVAIHDASPALTLRAGPEAMDASRRLGDEFLELAETGRWAERLAPL